VVLVHGLWMPGVELLLLAWRLRRAGYRTRLFHYRSVTAHPQRAAARLRECMTELGSPVVHLVAHSMGGLICRLAVAEAQLPPGRIVTLGTPHRGSYVARSLASHLPGRLLLGQSRALLGQGLGPWRGVRALGSIAGRVPVGVGRLLAPGLPQPHDGTVRLMETEPVGAQAHLALPVSHTSMLFSPLVARQVIAFLQHGTFTTSA